MKKSCLTFFNILFNCVLHSSFSLHQWASELDWFWTQAEWCSGVEAPWVNVTDERWPDFSLHSWAVVKAKGWGGVGLSRVSETMTCSNESVMGICWRESDTMATVGGDQTDGEGTKYRNWDKKSANRALICPRNLFFNCFSLHTFC